MGFWSGQAGAGGGGLRDMENSLLNFFSAVISIVVFLHLLKRKARKNQSTPTEADSEEVVWKEKMGKDTLIVLGIVFFLE
jgi:hypothetical protein